MKFVVALAVALVAAAAVAAQTVWKVGDTADDLALTMADGKEKKLSAWEGSALVLYFHSPTLRHAARDAKAVDGWRKTRAKQKLAVVGIARDAKAEDAKKFGEDNALGFPQAADAKAAVYEKFATKGLPYVVLLDAKRKIRHSVAGWDEEALETAVTELLGAKDPPPEKKSEETPSGDGEKK